MNYDYNRIEEYLKLCPYRKEYKIPCYLKDTTKITEEFLYCEREKCMKYNAETGKCEA